MFVRLKAKLNQAQSQRTSRNKWHGTASQCTFMKCWNRLLNVLGLGLGIDEDWAKQKIVK